MASTLKTVGLILLISILLPAIFYVGLVLWGTWHDEWSGYNYSGTVSDGICNIAVIPVTGEMTTFGIATDEVGEEILSTTMSDTLGMIGDAEKDPNIYGVTLVVDSGGGSPAAGQMIADELKNSNLWSAAFILDTGASAAYLASTGADTIIASPYANVGSIGVTMSYLDYTKYNEAEGIEFIEISSAKFKDAGSPDRPLTEEDYTLFKRDIDVMHEVFVDHVAKNRSLPREDVAKLADGSTVPASIALEKGLIDQIGNKETAREWFAEKLEVSPEDVVFCQ